MFIQHGKNLWQIWFELNEQIKNISTQREQEIALDDYGTDRLAFRMQKAADTMLAD